MATALYELSQSECEDLLRASTAARVAFVASDGPHIVPMNYTVLEGSVILRTSPTSLLGIYGRGARLAIEIDGFDFAHEQGWSVVARGTSQVIDDVRGTAILRAIWKPRLWVAGDRSLTLRIPWDELSGRRIGTGWSVVGSWAVSQAWLGEVNPPALGYEPSPLL